MLVFRIVGYYCKTKGDEYNSWAGTKANSDKEEGSYRYGCNG